MDGLGIVDEIVGAHISVEAVAVDALGESAGGVVVRIGHADELALGVVDRHADVATEGVAAVHKRADLYGLRLRRIEGLVCALDGERAALVEHQLGRGLQQSAVDVGIFAVVGVGEDGGEGAVEGKRLALEFASGLGHVEVGERVVGVALSFPAEVHVEESVLVKSVGHPGVSRCRPCGPSVQIDWTPVEQFLPQYLGKAAGALYGFGDIGSGVVEVLLQRLVGKESLGAARVGGVLHERGYAHVAHQQRHGVFLLLRGGDGVAVVGQHVGPVVARLAEVGAHRRVVVLDEILVAPLALGGPLVVVHHLRHRRGHASAVGVAGLGVEGVRLSPLALQQRLYGLGVERVAGSGADGHPALLDCLVGLAVTL